jgi:CheY-like chemotaxis protein
MKYNEILLIDDDRIYQHMIRRYIENYGFAGEFLTFDNGQLGFDYLQESVRQNRKLPDIILLDINMPVLDGWGFLHRYENTPALREAKIPIYLVTSSVDERDIERAKQYSAVHEYCTKPLSPTQLHHLLGT